MRQALLSSLQLDRFGTLRGQNKQSGLELAKILAVLGGLVTLFSGILAIISPFNSRARLSDLDLIVNVATYGFLVIALGLIAILGSKHVSSLAWGVRSEEHTSELQSPCNLVCRLLLEKKKTHRILQLRRA